MSRFEQTWCLEIIVHTKTLSHIVYVSLCVIPHPLVQQAEKLSGTCAVLGLAWLCTQSLIRRVGLKVHQTSPVRPWLKACDRTLLWWTWIWRRTKSALKGQRLGVWLRMVGKKRAHERSRQSHLKVKSVKCSKAMKGMQCKVDFCWSQMMQVYHSQLSDNEDVCVFPIRLADIELAQPSIFVDGDLQSRYLCRAVLGNCEHIWWLIMHAQTRSATPLHVYGLRSCVFIW